MKLRLVLFVAGRTSRSLAAIRNAERLRQLSNGNGIELSVVDVMADPERAERARILATPTLLRESPAPQRRVTGDLEDLPRVLAALGLDEIPQQAPEGP